MTLAAAIICRRPLNHRSHSVNGSYSEPPTGPRTAASASSLTRCAGRGTPGVSKNQLWNSAELSPVGISPTYGRQYRGCGFAAPAFREAADIHRVVAQSVQQLRCLRLRGRVVPGDGQRAAVGLTRRSRQGGQLLGADAVERLDHPGAGQVALHKFAGGQFDGIQLCDAPVALRVIVQGVDHSPAGQRFTGQLVIGVQRNGHHDEVTGLGRFGRCGRPGMLSEFRDEAAEGLGTARVAEDDVPAGGDGEAGQRASDHAAADESEGFGHGSFSIQGRRGVSREGRADVCRRRAGHRGNQFDTAKPDEN